MSWLSKLPTVSFNFNMELHIYLFKGKKKKKYIARRQKIGHPKTEDNFFVAVD